ncbi:MAG TPA: hypothetical protein VIU62_12750, partial [Chloroflexota bacterium]
MTPAAIARHAAALVHREDLRTLGYDTRHMYLSFPTLRAYYGRTNFCRGGSHWACNGRRGRERVHRSACPCPCHAQDGYRIACGVTEQAFDTATNTAASMNGNSST